MSPTLQPRCAGASPADRVADACLQVAAGKHAARTLAGWIAGVDVGETEFRLLWQLFLPDPGGKGERLPDQAELAAGLAISAAHVSAAVERLRAAGLVQRHSDPVDRRRALWRLTDAGRALIHAVLHVVGTAAREAA